MIIKKENDHLKNKFIRFKKKREREKKKRDT